MKKLYLLLVAGFLYLAVNAQTNTFPTPNGNVGIGNSSPMYPLQIGTTTTSGHATSTPTVLGMDDTYGTNTPGTNYKFKLFENSSGITSDYGLGVSAYLFEISSAASIGFFTNNTNQAMTILGSGKVGIGTTNPFAGQLHVNSNNAGGIGGALWITNQASPVVGARGRLAFSIDGSTDTVPNATIETVMTNSVNGAADLAFLNWSGTALNEHLRIKSNGYVGVGTSAPAQTLDVNGTERLNGDLIFGTDQTPYFIHGPTNGGAIRIRSNLASDVDRGVQFGKIDNNGIWYSYMAVDQGGNVGIGTTTPQTKLHILGPNLGSALAWTDAVNNTGYLSIRSGAAALGADNNLTFETAVGSAPKEMARFMGSTGHFGIGTTNPDEMLSVNGNIHAQEVLVNLSGFEDKVFYKNYHLPALSEVKSYIDKKHHLPEVPSEAEVIKNGIKVGDMERTLTKKVEELTLYLLQQKDQNDIQQKQLLKQQKQLYQLSEKLNALTKSKSSTKK